MIELRARRKDLLDLPAHKNFLMTSTSDHNVKSNSTLDVDSSSKKHESRKKTGDGLSKLSSVASNRSLPTLSAPGDINQRGRRSLRVKTKSVVSLDMEGIRTPYQEPKRVTREIVDFSSMLKGTQFHLLSVDETISALQVTDPKVGLSAEEVLERRRMFGQNKLKKPKSFSPIKLFLHHLFGILNIVLAVAGIAAIVTSILTKSFDWVEGLVIFGLIVMNTFIGFIQEYKSEKAIQSLMSMSKQYATVIRDGVDEDIESEELVIGDVVRIKDGDIVPADLRMINTVNLTIDEAFLTGESDPIRKQTDPLKESESEALGDRSNMAFMSSIVKKGRGTGIVAGVGLGTEIGKIDNRLKDTKTEKTNLQKTLQRMAILLFLGAIVLSFLAFGIQLLAIGTDAFVDQNAYLFVVALCVAIIPEALPAVLAVTLSVGMRKMAKKNAIVRKLPVLEQLNWVDVICSDKTGTLTEGKMRVVRVWTSEDKEYKVTGHAIVPDNGHIVDGNNRSIPKSELTRNSVLGKCIYCSSLCNMSTVKKDQNKDDWLTTGVPTEVALRVLSLKGGVVKEEIEENELDFITEYPFDSHWKKMSVVYKKILPDSPKDLDDIVVDEDEAFELKGKHISANEAVLFLKGSTEAVLNSSSHYLSSNGRVPMTPQFIKTIMKRVEEYSSEGYRVISLATKENFEYESSFNRIRSDENSTFIGIIGIQDAPRPESRNSVLMAHKMGIDVHMLTGDHALTAVSIAKQIGIVDQDSDGVMIGSDFQKNPRMSNGKLPPVVARCNPDTKIKMIEELHANKPPHVVCMCGDGVNDYAALKVADIGVAMGDGAEVTKSIAELVLLDSNFATIIDAIIEGRKIFFNIEKILLYLLTNNVAAVILLLGGLMFSFFHNVDRIVFPLSPMQILFLNVITNSPTCFCLAVEHIPSKDLEQKRDRNRRQSTYSVELLVDVLFYGFLVGIISLSSFAFAIFAQSDLKSFEVIFGENIYVDEYRSRAVAFQTIVYCMLAHSFNVLHKRNSMVLHQWDKSKKVIFAVAFGIVLVIPTIYIPWVNVFLFKQYATTYVEWIQVAVCVSLFVILAESYKLVKNLLFTATKFTNQFFSIAEEATIALREMSSTIKRIEKQLGKDLQM